MLKCHSVLSVHHLELVGVEDVSEEQGVESGDGQANGTYQ